LTGRRQRWRSSAAPDLLHSIWWEKHYGSYIRPGKCPRRKECLPRIMIYHVRLISAEQNRNRAYATWGLHCSFQSVNLHHGATALRPLGEAVGKCPTVSFCNHGQYFIDAVENHVMYSSQFAIDTSVNNPLHHARCHAKGDEVDWPPYKIRYQVYPSRFIMISISQCITEDKTHVI
jgi:hypothetical protein